MSFSVSELPRAKADKWNIVSYIHERSPTGAAAWLNAYDRAIDQLRDRASSYALAPENRDLQMEVRQILFKTRRGRVYRALFTIANDHAFVLRVRGPGQAPVQPEDLAG